MSSLYITEYERVYGDLPVEPAIAEQKVTISGVSAQSAALNPLTTAVRIHVDGITSVSFGVNPTATVSMARMAAGDTELRRVGGGLKVAGITNT
jgi:hypothetical protein